MPLALAESLTSPLEQPNPLTLGGESAYSLQVEKLFASSLLKLIYAQPDEILGIYKALTTIHNDPVVNEGRELLVQSDDKQETIWHQDRVLMAGHIVIERLLRLYRPNSRTEPRDLHAEAIAYSIRPEIPAEQLDSLENVKLFDLLAATHDMGKHDPHVQVLTNLHRRLTEEELAQVDEHADISAGFIANSSWDEVIKQAAEVVVRAHHAYKHKNPYGKRVNGRLQLMAEVLAFVDMLDPLSGDRRSGRFYKSKPHSRQETIVIVNQDFTGEYKDLLMHVCFGDTHRPSPDRSYQAGQLVMANEAP